MQEVVQHEETQVDAPTNARGHGERASTIGAAVGSRVSMLFLLLAAFGWRMIGLTQQSFWRDEIDVIFLSLRPIRENLSMFISPAQNGPLYYLLLRPWIDVAGSSEFAMRYTSVLFGVAAVALLWQVARRLLPGGHSSGLANAPLLTAIFLAINPYQLWYSQEGKMYALVVLLTLLSTWSWLEAMRSGGGLRWLRYLLVTTICIYTHLLTALILPLHCVWFLLAWPVNRRRWQGYAGALSGFVLPYLPLVWWQWHYLTSLDYETGYGFTPFAEVLRVLLLGHTRGAFVDVDTAWLVPIFFLGMAGLLVGYQELRSIAEDRRPLLLNVDPRLRMAMIAAWLVLPVLLIFGVSLIKPLFVDRYVIWIAPSFALLFAVGVQVIGHSGGRWATVLALLVVVYAGAFWLWTGWQQTHSPNKTQLREAVQYVAAQRLPDDLLILQIPHALRVSLLHQRFRPRSVRRQRSPSHAVDGGPVDAERPARRRGHRPGGRDDAPADCGLHRSLGDPGGSRQLGSTRSHGALARSKR
ncbi:MAG: glycosyltransferase family 39 protein [Caldilineaceae bacterium]